MRGMFGGRGARGLASCDVLDFPGRSSVESSLASVPIRFGGDFSFSIFLRLLFGLKKNMP